MDETIRIGFIPLCDAAPLVIAKEDGLFEAEGVDVELKKESSWAVIRDKLAYAELEAAHLLAPMVVASAFGIAPIPTHFETAFAFNLNGNGITVSNALYEEMDQLGAFVKGQPPTAESLRLIASKRLSEGRPPITLAMVYPYSTHNYLLRYWLAHAGLHPDRDVRLIVVPPAQMVSSCERGEIDGYCVGEPWNTVAVEAGIGKQIVFGRDIWSAAPEKVLGVRSGWLKEHNETHARLVRALLRATRILQTVDGQQHAAELLSQENYIGRPKSLLLPSLTGKNVRRDQHTTCDVLDYTVYETELASFPWHSKAAWIAVQMLRWGQLRSAGSLLQTVEQVFRTDIYREIAHSMGIDAPDANVQPEGGIGGSNQFMDGSVFLSTDPVPYLELFSRHTLREPLEELFT